MGFISRSSRQLVTIMTRIRLSLVLIVKEWSLKSVIWYGQSLHMTSYQLMSIYNKLKERKIGRCEVL